MRYRLRTLMILMAVLPPILAGAWWFSQRVTFWILALALIALIPELLLRMFGYTFYVLCRLAGGWPRDKDSE
jgi:hypothetical protein